MSSPDHSTRRASARDRLRIVARQEAVSTTVTPDASAPNDGAGVDDSEVVGDLTQPADARPRRATRIAPRAATRARRTWLALLFFPVFVIYSIVDAMRTISDRLHRDRERRVEARPPFRRPADMPPLAERSVADIAAVLDRFPFRPGRLSTSAAFFRDHGPDALGALLSPYPDVTTIPHLYPPSFQQRLFTGDQGVQLSGMQAMHEHRGPALVIAHGLLMTKNFDAIIQLARRAYEQWGFHVVTFDMRGWGQSTWTTDAPASAGYHEGRDILEIARELHRDPRVTSVAGIGFSLGGASMLNAAYAQTLGTDTPLDGGFISVSPPSMVDVALIHISTKPHWRDPFFGLWHVFQAAIKGTVRRRGLDRELRSWRDLVYTISAPYYGITVEEFAERASAVNFADRIRTPGLVLHAADDFLVTVQHAYALQDTVADNPNVHVMVRDAGAHVAFGAVDPSWYHSVVRRWLEYWATPGGDAPDPEDLEANIAG
jgi:predicted alpha/beta-fold hydrolase